MHSQHTHKKSGDIYSEVRRRLQRGYSRALRQIHIFSGKNRHTGTHTHTHTLYFHFLPSDINRHVHKTPLYFHLFLFLSICLTHTYCTVHTPQGHHGPSIAVMTLKSQVYQDLESNHLATQPDIETKPNTDIKA